MFSGFSEIHEASPFGYIVKALELFFISVIGMLHFYFFTLLVNPQRHVFHVYVKYAETRQILLTKV